MMSKEGFSPRNGEIIVKAERKLLVPVEIAFQSPQWGNNCKAQEVTIILDKAGSFSPRNGEIIVKMIQVIESTEIFTVSVPAMGK